MSSRETLTCEQMAAAHDAVTVVVVTFNSAHCMPALAQVLVDWPSVVIVDNASEDGCADVATRLLPHARVLRLSENLGFGAANNRGVELASTPSVLLLNPDCEISGDSIGRLWLTLDADSGAALCAPQLMRNEKEPEVNYRMASTDWASRGPAASGPLCVGFVCGAVMLLRTADFRAVGGFDERFFLYYEDDDLCLRLSQSGRSLQIHPGIGVLHRSRGSVRTRKRTQGEYLRGYHHAQSKLTFAHIHDSLNAAIRKRRNLLWLTGLMLPIRLLVWSPAHLARAWGRWCGALAWRR